MRRTTLLLICLCCPFAVASAWVRKHNIRDQKSWDTLIRKTGHFGPVPAPIEEVAVTNAEVGLRR